MWSAWSSARSTPSTRTWPRLGRVSPHASAATVDLPEPGGPVTATTSPGAACDAQAVEHEPAVEQHVDVVDGDPGRGVGREGSVERVAADAPSTEASPMSITSRRRSSALRKYCQVLMMPSSPPLSCVLNVASWNAMRNVPSVMLSADTSRAPTYSSSACVSTGSAFSGRLNRASSRARVIEYRKTRSDTAATFARSSSSRPNAFTTRMPRTGSSTAEVTSARSLSSAHDSAASLGRIRRSRVTVIGIGSIVTIASGGLRMNRYTPMPSSAGPNASAVGSRFMIDCTIWRSDSDRVMSWPPAIVSRSRTSAVWIEW